MSKLALPKAVSIIESNIEKSIQAIRGIQFRERSHTIFWIARRIASTIRAGNRVFIYGNGGSMAQAMHFAEEFTGRFRKDRKPLPVLTCADPSHITCVGNDFGFDEIFLRHFEGLMTPLNILDAPRDLILLLSTSGNSPNLVRLAEAVADTIPIVGILGRDGGALKSLCCESIVVNAQGSDRIQEAHLVILHILTEMVELILFGES
jgi:D-sedoheptulose 7-phosphate isomerase